MKEGPWELYKQGAGYRYIKTCNVNNTTKPSDAANLLGMGNNKNSNKSFISEKNREDDMKTNEKQSNLRNNNNDKQSFLSKQYKTTNMEAYTKMKLWKKKEKIIWKFIFTRQNMQEWARNNRQLKNCSDC